MDVYHQPPGPVPSSNLNTTKRRRDDENTDGPPHKRDVLFPTPSSASSSQRNLPSFSSLITSIPPPASPYQSFDSPDPHSMEYHNNNNSTSSYGGASAANGLQAVASPPLIPSPSPLPSSSSHFHHSSSSQHQLQHPFSPSTPSSYNFSTPSLSTGTMSTASSQEGFPSTGSIGGGPGSPMMGYPSLNSPSGGGYYAHQHHHHGGSPTGLGVGMMSPSIGGVNLDMGLVMGVGGKQPPQTVQYRHQHPPPQSQAHPTRIYIPPPAPTPSQSSNAYHQHVSSPRVASATPPNPDMYAGSPPSVSSSTPPGGGSTTKGKSPVARSDWDESSYASQHQLAEHQSMVAAVEEDEHERKGSELGIDLGDFDMLDTLGTGTFGKVLLSRLRTSPSRPAQTQPHFFAIKVLEKVTVVRLRQVEHLNSERKTLAKVRHPFIVNMFCTFQDERNLYLLLEYVQGGELFSHLRRAGRFSADVARFYAANLVLALEYLHEKDIIYRDLKPENLLIDASGYLKITDFGFAKHVTDRTYTLCGTPEYLAPEIITATGHGKAADFWALGVLLFELLAGYPPFFADSPLEIYEKILTGKFSFPPHIDFVAKDLIKRLLTADLSKRLGNLKDGAEGIKRHRWFEGVAWEAVERKEIRAPIIPHTATPGDTSNFEHYPACPLETLPGVVRAHHARQMGVSADDLEIGPDPYGYLFPSF